MSMDVEKVANLARLTLSENDKVTYPAQLNNILKLAGQMQAIDTTGVLPLAHPIEIHQPLREDIVTEKNQRDLFQSIAPNTEAGLYLVPQVLSNAKGKEKNHA